uniref:Uncharacterized protein n=1 Tax=Plectus sambesii TaxID=2011161 RepID=A0A914V9Z7_9BILA
MRLFNAYSTCFVLLLFVGDETEAAPLLGALTRTQGDVQSKNPLAILKGTGHFSKNVMLMKESHDSCANEQLSNSVNQALEFYSDDSEVLAQQIYSSISTSGNGFDNWVVQVAAVTPSSQWSYWGGANVFGSQYYCLIVTDQWFISVIRVDVR